MASKFVRTYTSFSGCDMIVSFGPTVIGELQQLTWAVQREKSPVYTLGNPDPRSYSRGKRAIAGNCVFAVFDRDALIDEFTKREAWEIIAPAAMFTARGNLIRNGNEDFTKALELSEWNKESSRDWEQTGYSGAYIDELAGSLTGWEVNPNQEAPTNFSDGMVNMPPGFGMIRNNNVTYADILPPVDITMTFNNELIAA